MRYSFDSIYDADPCDLPTFFGPDRRGHLLTKGTTEIGYTNRNNQTVIRKTNRPGTDHGQTVYEFRCGDCGRSHGANGSDLFQRRCPHCNRKSTGEDSLA